MEIKLSDILMLIAVVLAPLVAIQVSERLQKTKDKHQRKVEVFRTLMKTRASTLSPAHVESLNMIDVEFYGNDKKDKAVVEAWKSYLDHLNITNMNPELWGTKREDLLIDLLEKMAISLEYDFGKTHIKKTSYFPRGYAELELDQQAIRKGFVELLESKRAIPVIVFEPPTQLQSDQSNEKEQETA